MTKFEMQKGNVERLWSAFNLVDQDDELGDLELVDIGGMIEGIVTTVLIGSVAAYAASKAASRGGNKYAWGIAAASFPIPTLIASWIFG
jgi:hypothetical protein